MSETGKWPEYYRLLGVSWDATSEEIARAYRGLARQFHPDACVGESTGPDRFKAINEAYQVLSDPGRRRRYDRNRPAPSLLSAAFTGRVQGAQRHAHTGLRLGPLDVVVRLPIAPEEAIQGGLCSFRLTMARPCPTCHRGETAAGRERDSAGICPVCGGAGKIADSRPLTIRIPSGTEDRTLIRLAGQGLRHPAGREHGDLYIQLHIQPYW